jgi:peptidoglycan/LPS O-acetylase OafA/YrhL
MRYYSLQILRILFMAMVLILHVRAFMFIYGHATDTFLNAIPDAFLAAAFPFFSISGFIMAFLIDIGYRNFLIRRLLRIYPSFLIAVALAAAANYLLLDMVPGKAFLLGMTLLPVGPVDPPLRVEWTLVYEISYYLLITPFATRRLRAYYPAFLVLWGGVVLVAYYAFWMRSAYVINTFATVYFSSYNLYFITGGLVYHLQKHTRTRHWSWYAAGLLLGSAVTVITSYNRPFGGIKAMHEVGTWSLCTALCLYCAVKLEDTCRCRWLESLADFGEYTYAYYLIHAAIIMSLCSTLVYRLGIGLGDGAAVLALVLVGGIGLAFGKLDMAIHRYFRDKLR